jgi:hypothetical protein
VDFYPNGGSSQPGCGASSVSAGTALAPTVMKILGCHHVRSHELFTESITPTCPFTAIQCASYEVSLSIIIININFMISLRHNMEELDDPAVRRAIAEVKQRWSLVMVWVIKFIK